MAGIVHFSNFYRYMEMAEHDFFRSVGLSIIKKEPDGSIIGWPRVAASCQFEAPAYYEDELDVQLTLIDRGSRSLTWKVEFWNGSTRIAHGQMQTICCVLRSGGALESIDPPQEYVDRFPEPVDVSEP